MDSEMDVLILRLRRARLIASTVATILDGIHNKAQEKETIIVISGVSDKTMNILRNCGLTEQIGPENIFPATETPYDATRRALNKTKSLIAS